VLSWLFIAREANEVCSHRRSAFRRRSIFRWTTPYDSVQTVFKQRNPLYYGLITSFNLRGEPIVATPANAFSTFSRSEMDCLVLGDFLIKKP
jgi:carbamoyltransferase